MPIQGFKKFEHEFQKMKHTVFVKGQGPAILLMHELPGMMSECIAFAERLTNAGFKVYMPLFFGKPGDFKTNKFLLKLCISKEFYLFSKNRTSPIVDWLRDLCRKIKSEIGGKGMGAIGMCLTGGFAIPLLVEDYLIAPALSQPSLPVGFGKKAKANLGCNPEHLERAKERTEKEGIEIRAYRFDKDKLAAKERITAYQEYFGEAFKYFEIEIAQLPECKNKNCHAVFTADFVDEKEHPTYRALEDLIDFFQSKLM